jgi:hypothetical protein
MPGMKRERLAGNGFGNELAVEWLSVMTSAGSPGSANSRPNPYLSKHEARRRDGPCSAGRAGCRGQVRPNRRRHGRRCPRPMARASRARRPAGDRPRLPGLSARLGLASVGRANGRSVPSCRPRRDLRIALEASHSRRRADGPQHPGRSAWQAARSQMITDNPATPADPWSRAAVDPSAVALRRARRWVRPRPRTPVNRIVRLSTEGVDGRSIEEGFRTSTSARRHCWDCGCLGRLSSPIDAPLSD